MTRTHQRRLWLAVLTVGLLAFIGCQKPVPSTEPDNQTVTFRTAGPAPDGFDAWDFVWKGPKRASNMDLESVVLQPDGTEYAKQNFAAYPGKSESIQSSFSRGFAGGDPKVFYRQPIRFRFRAAKGGLLFAPADIQSFRFRFFRKDANGDVDWRKPFQTIDAVIEP